MSDKALKEEMTNEEKNDEVQVEESKGQEQAEGPVETNEVQNEEMEEAPAEDDEKVKLEQEIEELKSRYLRVQADYDNFRKRTKSEKEASAKYRSQSLAEQLLPVLDNFERALVVETTNEESKSILTGVDMVYRQLKDALQQEGVEEVEALGKPFDPHVHQAVMQEKSEEHDSGIVTEVFQKGYRLKDRVIRPAMVKVSE